MEVRAALPAGLTRARWTAESVMLCSTAHGFLSIAPEVGGLLTHLPVR